jgi:hypothetical protein
MNVDIGVILVLDGTEWYGISIWDGIWEMGDGRWEMNMGDGIFLRSYGYGCESINQASKQASKQAIWMDIPVR